MFQAAITSGKWKLIWGQDYLLKKPQPFQSKKKRLYDIMNDPNEIYELSKQNPEVEKQKNINLQGQFSAGKAIRKRDSSCQKGIFCTG